MQSPNHAQSVARPPVFNRWLSGLAFFVLLLAGIGRVQASNITTNVQIFIVPFPEADFQTSLKAINTGGSTSTQIKSTISIVVPTAGTVIVYDHWEDGYEPDLNNPVQVKTQIWGDGNTNNGTAPGYPTDVLPAGAVITLQNNVPLPRSAGTILYDGRDRIGASAPIAVTRAGWATNPGTLLASATEVYDTRRYGTAFRIPVGTTSAANQLFTYSGLHIVASQDNTTVSVFTNSATTNVVIKSLNNGDSMFINGGVLPGAIVTSTKPVQVHEITGRIGSAYQSRTFAIRPTAQWGTSYYAPVGTTLSSEVHNIYFYNPATTNITITYETKTTSGTLLIPANGNNKFAMPLNSGGHFYTTNSEIFYAVGCNDSGSTSTSANSTHDWGYALLPESFLTTGIVIGWGPGSDSTISPPTPDGNGSPVWITPTANTTVYVNYSGNTNSGTFTATNGWHYDISYSVAKLASQTIYDTSDKDMTRARIFTTDGTRIAAAWGEDPSKAGAGAPYLDLGTTIVPFPVPTITKTVTNLSRLGNSQVGDTLQYIVKVSNEGVVDLNNTVLLDSLPSALTYVPGTTYINGVLVPDDTGTNTAFPVDETGFVLDAIPAGSFTTVKYNATITGTGSNILNIVSANGAGAVLTASQTVPVVAASVTYGTVTFTDASGNPTNYNVGDNIYVTLVDTNANTSSTNIDTQTVIIQNTTTGDLEIITLTETGPNTGIFRNTTPLPSSATAGSSQQDGTLNVTAGSSLVVTYSGPIAGDTATNNTTIVTPSQTKQLYLSSAALDLNRTNPVTAGGSLLSTVTLGTTAAATNTIAAGVTGSWILTGTDLGSFSTITSGSLNVGTGSNRLLMVSYSVSGVSSASVNIPTNSAVSFAGHPLTRLGLVYSTGGATRNITGDRCISEVWYLTNPPSGSGTITTTLGITNNASYGVYGAVVFSNVNLTASPFGTVATANNGNAPSTITVSSIGGSVGDLVFDSISIRGVVTNTIATNNAAQTVLWNSQAQFGNNTVGAASYKIATTTNSSMTWTWTSSSPVAMNAVAIKGITNIVAGGGTSSVTFTQAVAMKEAFTIPAGGVLNITNFVTVASGTMPANPAITAILLKGTSFGSATPFATMASPVYNASSNTLVWNNTFTTNVNFSVGDKTFLTISNIQSGVTYTIDYNSAAKPAAIYIPTTTVITLDSFGLYDAPYPGGSLITSTLNGQRVYARAQASDPFGSYDISSMGFTIIDATPTTNTTNIVVSAADDGTSKIFEYSFLAGSSLGSYTIIATAHEGSEGVTDTGSLPLQVSQLDLGTPSTTVFTDISGNTVTTYTSNGPVYLQVTDPNRNTNATTVQSITAIITTSTGDLETNTLFETGINTGIFRGTNAISWSAVTVGNGTLNINPGASILATYTDPTDASDVTTASATIAVTAGTPTSGIFVSRTSPTSGKALVGDTITFNVQVSDPGSSTLSSLVVSNNYSSAQLQYVSSSVAPATSGTGYVTWNIASLTNGQVTNFTISYTAIGTSTTATNNAVVNSTPTAGPSFASVQIDNTALSITNTLITPSTNTVYVGDTVVYRIAVTNIGTTSITNIPLQDFFSGGSFSYVSATLAPDSTGSGSLLWDNVGPLAPGAGLYIDVTLKVTGAGDPANNTADISYATDSTGKDVPPVDSTVNVMALGGTVTAIVYQDRNNSHAYNSGEGMTNVYVYADLNNNSIRDVGEPFSISDTNGVYNIYNLAPGTYTIRVDTNTLPSGITRQIEDPDATLDSATIVTLTTASLTNTTSQFGYDGFVNTLLVSETANPSSISGGPVTYSVTITNTGTIGIYLDSIQTVLATNPAFTTNIAGTSTFTNGVSNGTIADPTATGNTNVWTGPFYIPPHSTGTLYYNVNFPTTLGSYTNYASATVTPSTIDTTTTLVDYSPAGAVVTVTNQVTLSQSATPTTIAGGGTVTYTITITNAGAYPATLTSIDAILPTTPGSVTNVTSSSTFNGGGISDPTLVGNTNVWTGPFTIPAGGTRTLTYQIVLPAVIGSYTDQAFALSGTNVIDTTVATGDFVPSSTVVTVGNQLALSAAATPTSTSGGVVNYTVTLINSGSLSVSVDSIQVVLPTAPGTVTNVPGSSLYNAVAISDPVTSGNTNTWTGPFTIPAGSSKALAYQVILPAVLGSYTNAATAYQGTNLIDTTFSTADNSPALAIVGVTNAVLISQSANPTSLAGGIVTYTITLTNAGGFNTTLDSIKAALPTTPGVATNVPGSSTFGGSSISNPTLSGGTNTWTGPFTITNGTTVTLTYQLGLPNTLGTYTDSAFALAGTNIVDSTYSTADFAPAPATVTVTNAVLLFQTATPSTTSGGPVTYTITLTNAGSYFAVVDSVTAIFPTNPASITYTPGSSMFNLGGISDPTTTGNTNVWAGPFPIPPGGSRTVTYTVTFPSTGGTYTNDAFGNIGTNIIDTTYTTGDYSPSETLVDVGSTLLLSQSASPVMTYGGAVTYTVTVTNTGSSSATLDTLKVIIPTNPATPSYISGSSKSNGVAYSNPSTSGNTNIYTGPFIIPSGTALSFTYQLTLASTPLGNYTNYVFGLQGTNIVDTTPSLLDYAPAPVTVTVVDNFPPTLDSISDVTTNEDAGLQTVLLTGISDGDGGTQTLSIIASSTNPTLIPNPVIGFTNGQSTAILRFQSITNLSGTAIIAVRVTDDGSTNSTNYIERDFLITVNPVNDAPSFTKGHDQRVSVLATSVSITNWAYNISPGPSDESTQTVSFVVTNDNNALFTVQPAIGPDGKLTYTSAGSVGVATVGVYAQDNGGTANGGVDVSPVQTFSIEVVDLTLTNGFLAVADRGPYFQTGTILMYNTNGTIEKIITTSIKDPYEIVQDNNGDILMTDYEGRNGADGRRIYKINAKTLVETIVSDKGLFDTPYSLRYDNSPSSPNYGKIIVADLNAYSNNSNTWGAVFIVDPNTGAQTLLSSKDVGTGPVFFHQQGMCVDPSGNIYVGDIGDPVGGTIPARIFFVNPTNGNRTVLASGSPMLIPVGMQVLSGTGTNGVKMVVVDAGTKALNEIDFSTFPATFTVKTPAGITLNTPTHVSLDDTGTYYYLSDAPNTGGVGLRHIFRVLKAAPYTGTIVVTDGLLEQPRGNIYLQNIP